MATPLRAVEEQQKIQAQVMEADKAHPEEEMKGAMQAGARRYPEPPMPAQGAYEAGSRIRPDAEADV